MEIVTQTAPPDKKGFYIMNDIERLLATINGVQVPQAYDLKAWEADAMQAAVYRLYLLGVEDGMKRG